MSAPEPDDVAFVVFVITIGLSVVYPISVTSCSDSRVGPTFAVGSDCNTHCVDVPSLYLMYDFPVSLSYHIILSYVVDGAFTDEVMYIFPTISDDVGNKELLFDELPTQTYP